ncbi:MAG: MFS transporter [Roseovarius sp.]|uniref:MFS transporter n=1 Tax=Roseovarius sp. TaxID=1486281 RepID=UPI0032EB4DF4
MTSHDPSLRAGKREWAAMAILALPCLLYSMDLTVLNLAVPELSTVLRPSETQLLWIVDIYGFILAAALIPMGVFGDRIGRRRLLLWGAFAFGAASLIAAFAQTAPAMIAARAFMGLAAATLAPSTLSMISTLFPHPQDRQKAIGIWIASFSSGGALGPVIGGVLLEYFWWGSVFLINLPVMALLLLLGPLLLPEARNRAAPRPDLPSAAALLLAVLTLVCSIKQVAAHGWTWPVLAALALCVVAAWAFLRRQGRLAEPFLDLGMFRSVRFSAALGINVLGFFIAFGSFLLIALYLQMGLGMSQLHAGLAAAPSGLAFIVGAVAAPGLVTRLGTAGVMACGFLLAAAGFGLTGLAAAQGALALLIASYCVFSLGLAPIFTLTTDVIVGSVPPEKAGAAAGLSETSTELGGALGIAVLGSLLTLIYRVMLADSPHLLNLPMSVATGAGGTAGDVIMAREALGLALQTSAWLCGLVAVLGAALTALIRSRDPQSQPLGDTL